MHLTYAKMLAIVVHENMKLGDNTLNREARTCKHKISAKIFANCSPYFAALRRSPYFTALQYINNLETKRSCERKVNLKNLKF